MVLSKQLMISEPPRSNTNAASIELSGVRREIRFFVEQYRQGRRQTTELVSTESLNTRKHVSKENLNTRKHVSLEAKRTNDAVGLVGAKVDRLVTLEHTQIDERARESFLESLKYPGFNQRRSQINDAYINTLNWIFAGDNDEKWNDDSGSYEHDDSVLNHASSSKQSGEMDQEGLSDPGHHSDHSNGSDRQHRPGDPLNTGASRSANETPANTVLDPGVTDSEEEENRDHEASRETRWNSFSQETRWNSFSNWLSSTDVLYWISGKPGSGKTTVMKYILNNEQTKKYLDIWCPGCTIISHFFWLPGSPMQRNIEGLLCSVLYQLLENNLNALIEAMSLGSKSSHTDWSHAELQSSVTKALDWYKDGVCLFLDGIDEIKPEDGTKDGIPEFLDWAIELSQRNKPIKLVLASRPDPYILETRLSRYPRMRLQDLNYQDLVNFATGRVKILEKDIFTDARDELIESLADKAEGVFLWLILAIKSVNEGLRNDDSVELLQERINCLPQGLDSLYNDMWARAGADNPAEYRQTAALYFKLLLESRASSWGGGINAFDVMLATTDLADSVLHAIANPSKLVREDDMLQQYMKVEKKLNIYCVGLIETIGGYRYMKSADFSWYGRVYDRIFPVAMGTRLDFVHRTARDFLTDTKSGREILEFDTSSDSFIECRLLHAMLASIALFARDERNAFNCAGHLKDYLNKYAHIDNESPQSWNRLVSFSEQLADSGRLLVRRGSYCPTYRCSGAQFLNLIAASYVGDANELLISRIKNRSPSRSEKSSFLLASISGGIDNIQPLFRTCREMLRAGADPNLQGWLEWGDFPSSMPHTELQTPWRWLLVLTVQRLLHRTYVDPLARALSPTELTSLAEVLLLFISEGARLSDPVNVAFYMGGGSDTTLSLDVKFGHRVQTLDRKAIFTSIPAYMIVKLLTAKYWRGFCSTSDTRSFPKVFADLENACESYHSSGTCRVFGRSKIEEEGNRCTSWWETTNDMQTQLGSKLMEWLGGNVLLPRPVEGADVIEMRRVHVRFWELTKLFDLIWFHESWTMRNEELDFVFISERLVELGVLMSLVGAVEFHTRYEWVRKHNIENPQYGGTT